MKKLICTAVALAMALMLPLSAAAAQTGSIRVTLKSGDSPVVGGTVTLFRVGQRCEEGFRISDAFGGGMVRYEDALSPHLAQWLVQMEGEEGISRILDADGSAYFSRLEEGLYLLVQKGSVEEFFPIMPFLMILPYEGQWNVEAYPYTQVVHTENPPTGQHPAPILGALGMVVSGIGLALCTGKRRRK